MFSGCYVFIKSPHSRCKPTNIAEISGFRFQIVPRGGVGSVHLRRFISSGLLLSATSRKPPTYPQKLIHSYDPFGKKKRY